MTGLPKELITCTKRSSSVNSDEHSLKKPALKRFKECMEKGHKEKPSSNSWELDKDEKALSEDGENTCASPLSLYAHLIHKADGIPGIEPGLESGPVSGSTRIACAEIEALFEKMASTMLVMNSAKEQETTLFLDSPQFSSSAFFGTRITIKEFSTAPKVFNIEIATHQTALNLLTTHKDALLAAFEGHRLPFTVNRLDTELHSIDEHAAHRHSDKDGGQNHKEDEPS